MPPPKNFKPTAVAGLQPKLVKMLDEARGLAGVPFVITSGLRDMDANAALAGSAKDSSHLRGWAVDLRTGGSRERFMILSALLHVGFTRVGIYLDGHIHVDCDPSLPPDVCWVKP